MNTRALKERLYEAIDRSAEAVERYVRDIQKHPELGFAEYRTAEKMAQFFREIGLEPQTGLAVTGMAADLDSGKSGPTIAFMGELDAIVCRQAPYADPETGAAHQCGHHVQQGVLLAAAAGFTSSGVLQELCGRIRFLGAPAEEMGSSAVCQPLREQGKIQYICGKQELIRQGVLDDVDISMMMHCWSHHPGPLILRGVRNLGAVTLLLNFYGKQAHAAAEPFNGINALNAAIAGINAVNAMRESFDESESPRVNYIITHGGEMVNCIPDFVQVKVNIRANTLAGMERLTRRVVNAFRLGAECIGARMECQAEPGIMPLVTDDTLYNLYTENAKEFVPPEEYQIVPTMPSSSDLGDVSQLMPVLYPMCGGIEGTGHGSDFQMVDFQNAVVLPAKLLGAVIIDLLAEDGKLAKQVVEQYKPGMTKEQYLHYWEKQGQD